VGGRLTVAYRSEPKTFNRLVSPHLAEDLVARLTQATLVRLDRTTGELEPRLARAWQSSPDGLTWILSLVEGQTFSDGTPFTSADVVFTFQALFDPKVKSETVEPADRRQAPPRSAPRPRHRRHRPARSVRAGLPPDSVPILPRHARGRSKPASSARRGARRRRCRKSWASPVRD
jgi:peptide/nickel transport system substrate-binding protein